MFCRTKAMPPVSSPPSEPLLIFFMQSWINTYSSPWEQKSYAEWSPPGISVFGTITHGATRWPEWVGQTGKLGAASWEVPIQQPTWTRASFIRQAMEQPSTWLWLAALGSALTWRSVVDHLLRSGPLGSGLKAFSVFQHLLGRPMSGEAGALTDPLGVGQGTPVADPSVEKGSLPSDMGRIINPVSAI